MGFDFGQIKNVFIFGAGVSVGRGIPVGEKLLADVFRIYNNPQRKTNDEGPFYKSMYLEVMRLCKQLYNLEDGNNVERIEEFASVLEKNCIDFEDFLSRIYLRNQSDIFTENRSSQSDIVEPNLMRLLYWYFWHHSRNWDDPDEFPRVKDREYVQLFLSKLDCKSAILTTNYDLLFERIEPLELLKPEKWKVAYSPEWIIKNDKILYLKLHGSINWIAKKSLPDEIEIQYTAGRDTIKTEIKRVDEYPNFINNTIKLFHQYFRDTQPIPTLKAVILPPTLYKGLYKDDPVLSLMVQEVWGNAKKCLAEANKIIFAGLSLRETDIMLQLLIKDYVNTRAEIYLINPSTKEEKKMKVKDRSVFKRYRKIFDVKEKNYFDCEFEYFAKNKLDEFLSKKV